MQEYMGSLCVKDKTEEKFYCLNISGKGIYSLSNEMNETVVFTADKLYELFSYGFQNCFEFNKKPERHVCEHSGVEWDVKN